MAQMTHEKHASINDDPFNGYASCPDKCRAYISTPEIINKYGCKSTSIIRNSYKIDSFKTSMMRMPFLRIEGMMWHLSLNKNLMKVEWIITYTFRNEDDHFRLSISAGDGEYLKWQKKKYLI